MRILELYQWPDDCEEMVEVYVNIKYVKAVLPCFDGSCNPVEGWTEVHLDVYSEGKFYYRGTPAEVMDDLE